MNATAAHHLVDSIGTLPSDRVGLLQVVKDCHRLAGWVEVQRLQAVAALDRLVDVSASHEVAAAARTSRYEGERVVERSNVVGSMPELGEALSNGAVNVRHLDAAANVLGRAEPQERAQLASRSKQWARAASSLSVGEFQRFAEKELRDVQGDDGVARFEQQRRDARLKMWNDPATGMVMGRFALDPENGAALMSAVRGAVEALFHDRQPDTCPTDPFERQEHLQALALMSLIRGEGSGLGRPEVIVVVDVETLRNGLHAESRVETADGVDLPVETVRRKACEGDIIPVVLGSDGEALDVGRRARLATAAQRRALRVMFRTCWIPGCDVPFDMCTVHHLRPWETGGATDLVNLRPTCNRHHHDLHEGGWLVETDGWWATVSLPDGTVWRTGPPAAETAA